MRKALWIIPVLLLMGALGAPYANADIVQVDVSNLKFIGNNACPPPSGTALCTQTFTESFQWDNSNAAYVSGSLSFSTSGDLGSTWSLQAVLFDSSGNANAVHSTLIDPAGDLFDALLGAPGGILSPGTYNLTTNFPPNTALPAGMAFSILSCGSPTCAPLFSGTANIPTTIGSVAVAAVPEPGTEALMLIGIGLVLVMRKRIAEGLPQAT